MRIRAAHSTKQHGQALVEYALIAALVAVAFGLALAATGPVIGNVFDNAVNDVLRQTVIADAPGRDEFWGTVTGVYAFTPSGGGIATNTLGAPTDVPTAGPSPTPTPTYTASPTEATPTPPLTATQEDQFKLAPFLDTVDEPRWWRIDSNIFLRGLPWKVSFFPNTTLSGLSDKSLHDFIDERFDYDGEFVAGYPASNPGERFSARFTREIELLEDQTLSFRILADDGVRVNIDGTPVTLTNPNGQTNSWIDQPPTLWTGAQVVAAGTHVITVEYYQNAGGARLKVEVIGGGANPDDGSTVGGSSPFMCNWGRLENNNDANTESYFFDEYISGQMTASSTCYLEWRGAAVLPNTLASPQLVFWDVWDFSGSVDGWLEIGEYIPVDPIAFPPELNRSAMTWTRIDLDRTANTANYNWTRNVIDLAPYVASFATNRLAFRFAIETGAGNPVPKWQIDDIEVRDLNSQTFTADRLWTLNNADERFDFLYDGGRNNPGTRVSGWGLVSNNKLGTSGLAFHDSVSPSYDDPSGVAGDGTVNGQYTRYKKNSQSPVSDADQSVRVHSLEFNGFIDLLNAPNPDSAANTGELVLGFYQGYHLGSRTGVAVQYTTDGYDVSPANWITFPEGGLIRPITATGEVKLTTLQETIVSLADLPGDPERIRIRFAMFVHAQADPKDGWWIDQIRLGREESPKWANYPFFDDGQGDGPLVFWRYAGSWSPTIVRGHPKLDALPTDVNLSYGSSPVGAYANDQVTALTLRWPIDLYNDTPDKRVIITPGGLTGTTNSYGSPAVNPELTFYHWRELALADAFEVQWKRVDEPDASWRLLWTYGYGMATTTANARTASNRAWEFTRVSLYPVMRQIALDGGGAPGVGTDAALRDDDIVLRFVLRADGANNAAGIFVDDIQVQEKVVQTIRLWPTNETRPNFATGVDIGTGTGTAYFTDPDFSSSGLFWSSEWLAGGTWNSVGWESREGVFSFHDSPVEGQDRAPTGLYQLASTTTDLGNPIWYTPDKTFNVLELDRVIDLRGVRAEDEAPMLTFWTRYHIGEDDFMRVQVSTEDTRSASAIDSSMSARCLSQPVLQCYEQERGWSPWVDLWFRGSITAPIRNFGWERIMVDLKNYAYSPSGPVSGQRIRIRFVLDSLENVDNRDGWYIDTVQLEHRLPYSNVTVINQQPFDDRSRSIANWTAEGNWGLDTSIYQGGGGGPVTLGLWDVDWWQCNECESLAPGGTSNSNKFRRGAEVFLANPAVRTPDREESVFNIQYRPGSGSPVLGWPATDRLVARLTLDTPVVGFGGFSGGMRSFSTRSDDGVRLKIAEIDSNGVEITPTPDEWNVIDVWTDHAERGDQGLFTFEVGKRYRLTLIYYDKSGDAVLSLTVNDGRYSFSDSPKTAPGATPDRPAIPFSSTALVLKNPLDLTGMAADALVLLEYQNKYRVNSGETLRLEVSVNGGFNWITTGLTDSSPGLSFSGVNITNGVTGLTNPQSDPWQVRLNNLTRHKGTFLLIRFRYDRVDSNCYRRGDCDNSDVIGPAGDGVGGDPSRELVDGYYNGWWITPVRVLKFE